MPEGYWTTGAVTAAVVVLCVLLHYEGLRILTNYLPMPRHHHRKRIIVLILSLLLLHIAEIWIFGGAYYVLLHLGGFGEFIGVSAATFIDCIYYSATVYTTIGFGDVVPIGAIRTMTGTEGIVGLTFIAWSASYTFVEMLKTWNHDE